MSHFTPVAALCGGALIGLSAALLWLTTGRVAGISGIAGGLLHAPRGETAWRVAFLSGLIAAPLLLAQIGGWPAVTIEAGPVLILVAGFLVGVGTRLGGGCTSGHGVCGLSRGSPRSIAATGIFMAVAVATVFAMRHLTGHA